MSQPNATAGPSRTKTYVPHQPSPLSGSDSNNEDSPEQMATPVNRRPNQGVINTANRLQAVVDDQLSPIDQRRRVGLAANLDPLSHPSPAPGATPTPSGRRPTTAGARQRQEGQQMQTDSTNVISANSRFQTSQLTATEELRSRVQRLEEDVRRKEAVIQSLRGDVEDLKASVAGLQAGTHQEEPAVDNSQEEKQKRAISRMVKSAVETLYGDTKMSTCVTEGGQTDEMRWNYQQAPTSVYNDQQTRRVLALCTDNRESIPLTKDNPRESIPDYKDAKDLFHEAIRDRFYANQSTHRKGVIARWGEEGPDGPREKLLEEIRVQEQLRDNGDDEESTAAEEALTQLNQTLDRNDSALAAQQGNAKPNIRSKLNAAVTRMNTRRPRTIYADEKYEGLACFYWIPPLYCDQSSGSPKWHEAEWEGVYSQQYIKMHKSVWNLKMQTKGSGKRALPVAPGPTFDELPEGEERRPVELYLPSSLAFLHQAPQRWMFCQAWLDDPENAEVVESRIVPVDEPTSFSDVEKMDWILNHPWTIMKAKRSANEKKKVENEKKKKKRAWSESTQAATTDSETHRPMSATSTALNRGRSAQPAERTIKRPRTDRRESSIAGETIEEEDDMDEPEPERSEELMSRQPNQPEPTITTNFEGRNHGVDQSGGASVGWNPGMQAVGFHPGWAGQSPASPFPVGQQYIQGNVNGFNQDRSDPFQVSRHPNDPRFFAPVGSGYGPFNGGGFVGQGGNVAYMQGGGGFGYMNGGGGGPGGSGGSDGIQMNGGGAVNGVMNGSRAPTGIMTTLYDKDSMGNASPSQQSPRAGHRPG
ncbi:hypothetical protein FFLO_04107 [Filobasidium floriforme]|uniref:Uncharacterized protein n=1 Tax=Filobasidium floriforme TaxID=5210 RepID=A0A8K0JKV7_9TREE|nr:uncharacterized protein HD553DRAFT_341357 [Filobasidium floriforme]KAG7531802.1 hypothetical protein FFLO_04107 [Filobasidium floriforme]KAH8086515.1 hypothetical protein HD553DRAFT_341357 [Filobasidium floriforme]